MFQGPLLVIVIMIDDSEKRSKQFASPGLDRTFMSLVIFDIFKSVRQFGCLRSLTI